MIAEISASLLFILILSFLPFLLPSEQSLPRKKAKGKVDIAVFALNEDENIIKETLNSLKGLGRIYLIKGGSHSESLEKFCQKQKIAYIYFPQKGKAKALNYFLSLSKAKYVAIFDCDEKLVDRNFIKDVLHHFDNKTIYIQTLKTFPAKTIFQEAFKITNEFFLNIIERKLSCLGKAFFTGSLAILDRKKALELSFKDVSIEDIDFSLRALQSYKGYFLPKAYAYGKTPSFISFLRQHMRYAYGNGELLRKYKNPILFYLPFFSFFNSILLLSLSPFAYLFLSLEILFATALGFFLFKKAIPSFIAITLNILISPLRVYFSLLGYLSISLSFSPTHS